MKLEQKGGKSFQPDWKREQMETNGNKWTILIYVGRVNQATEPNFRVKTASQFRSFETALSSLDLIYRKLQKR